MRCRAHSQHRLPSIVFSPGPIGKNTEITRTNTCEHMLHHGSLSPSLLPPQAQNRHPTHNPLTVGGGALSEHPAIGLYDSPDLTLRLGLSFSTLLESQGCLSDSGSTADKTPELHKEARIISQIPRDPSSFLSTPLPITTTTVLRT